MSEREHDDELPVPPTKASLTYGDYLKVEELLQLQVPRSSPVEHDELLFIIIHQVYELWFRLLLHEGGKIRADLFGGRLFDGLSTLGRVRMVLKTLVAQLDVLETMTPTEFLTFRDHLDRASGFQSDQFRQLEFVLGRKSRQAVERFDEGTRARRALEARWEAPTIWDALVHYLAGEGYPVPQEALDRDPTGPIEPSTGLQDVLVDIYRNDPQNAQLCEHFVDLDEGVQEWRYRHIKMVERTIGMKTGTGGSAGSAYLRTTLTPALFPDLWEIRSRL